jgi:hypothetical protein
VKLYCPVKSIVIVSEAAVGKEIVTAVEQNRWIRRTKKPEMNAMSDGGQLATQCRSGNERVSRANFLSSR